MKGSREKQRRETPGASRSTSRVNYWWVDYRPLHLAVPVLRLGIRRTEHLEVPLAAAPRLDDLGRDHVNEDFGKCPALRVALEVIGGLVPGEAWIEHHRQEQIVPVVDDD